MKAVLLRVGIDKGYGFLSPVFQDLSFRYIPIYYKNKIEMEKKEKRETERTFQIIYFKNKGEIKNGRANFREQEIKGD